MGGYGKYTRRDYAIFSHSAVRDIKTGIVYRLDNMVRIWKDQGVSDTEIRARLDRVEKAMVDALLDVYGEYSEGIKAVHRFAESIKPR